MEIIFYIVDNDTLNSKMGTQRCVSIPTMATRTSHDVTFNAGCLSCFFLMDNYM